MSSWDKKFSSAFDSCYSSESTSEDFQIFILGVKLPLFVLLLTKQHFPDIGTCQADMYKMGNWCVHEVLLSLVWMFSGCIPANLQS